MRAPAMILGPSSDRAKRKVWLSSAVLLCVLVFLVMPGSAPAHARSKTQLKLATPIKVAPGTPKVQLRATLTGRVAGRVRVQHHTGKGWRTVRRVAARPHLRVVVKLPTLPARFRLVAGSGARKTRSRTVKVRTVSWSTPRAADPESITRARILSDTNTFRAVNGQKPLRPMPQLDRVATQWSQRMASTDTMSHNPHYSAQYPGRWRAAAENVAFGYRPNRVVKAWSRSPGHRQNLLGGYTHLGIGYAADANGTAYYTQNFARY